FFASEGCKRAKARAVLFGRPSKLTPHQRREENTRRDAGDETLADIGRSYNVSTRRSVACVGPTGPRRSAGGIGPPQGRAPRGFKSWACKFRGEVLGAAIPRNTPKNAERMHPKIRKRIFGRDLQALFVPRLLPRRLARTLDCRLCVCAFHLIRPAQTKR